MISAGRGVDGDRSAWFPNIFFSGGPGLSWWRVHLAFRTRAPDVTIWMRDCCTSDFYGTMHVHIAESDALTAASTTKCKTLLARPALLASRSVRRALLNATGQSRVTLTAAVGALN